MTALAFVVLLILAVGVAVLLWHESKLQDELDAWLREEFPEERDE